MYGISTEQLAAALASLDPEHMILQGASTVTLVLLVYGLHRFVRYAIAQLVTRPESRQRYWSYSRLLFAVVGIVLIGAVWLEELKTVSLVLTGLIAATMIANKEIILGLAGRMSLAVADHYELGDRILINGVCGDVINIGLLYTWLLEVDYDGKENQGTGKVVLVPHIWLTLYAVYNSTLGHDFIYDELELALPMDVDARPAMKVATATADKFLATQTALAALDVPRLSRAYAAKTPPVTPIAYVQVRMLASGHQYLALRLRFTVRARERRNVNSQLTLRVVEAIKAAGITLFSALHNPDLALPEPHPAAADTMRDTVVRGGADPTQRG